MVAADHCQKVLPRVDPRNNAYLQVQCPVCLALWIYENRKWTQITLDEQKRQGLVV